MMKLINFFIIKLARVNEDSEDFANIHKEFNNIFT